MPNIATITNNVISALSGTTSQVLLGDATLTDFKLDSLTDVNVPTPGDGDVLRWNATTSLWEASDAAGITGSGSAGQVAYFTGATTQSGSNNLSWDATNGRLGIGTNAPSYLLDINGTPNYLLRIRNTSATSAATMVFTNTSGEFYIGNDSANGGAVSGTTAYARLIWGQGAYPMVFATNNVERMRITSAGDVGIGTTAPTMKVQIDSTGFSLRLRETSNSTSLVLSGNQVQARNSSDGGSPLYLNFTNGGNILTGSGNVGINISNPVDLLTVGSSTGASLSITTNQAAGSVATPFTTALNFRGYANAILARIETSDVAQNFSGAGIIISAKNNSNVLVERMRISDNGNVGIGQSTVSGVNLRVSKNITGQYINSGGSYGAGIVSDGMVMSDEVGGAAFFRTFVQTENATFTAGLIAHYEAVQGNIGTGSTVSSQAGFFANHTLVGAVNNFGFYGNIPTGANRWNLYMNGTAPNYMSGSLGIGTITSPAKLAVLSTIYDGPDVNNKGAFQLAFGNTNGLSFGTYNASPFANYIQSIDYRVGFASYYPLSLQPQGGNLLIGRILDSGDKLQVSGSIWTTGYIKMAGTNAITTAASIYINPSSKLYFGRNRLRGYIERVISGISTDVAAHNTYYEIGSAAFSSLEGSFEIDVTFAGSGYGQSSKYILPVSYAMDYLASYSLRGPATYSAVWMNVQSVYSAPRHLMPNSANWELQIKIDGNAIAFRIVIKGGSTGTCTAYVKINHSNDFDNVVWTEQTGTGVDATTYSTLNAILSSNIGNSLIQNNLLVGGNVGIGTSAPSRKLQINESSANTVGIAITNSSTTVNGLQLLVDGAGGAALWNYSNTELTFGTNNNERLRITNTGNVGIGTTAPTSKLHVVGNGLFTNSSTETIFEVSSTWSNAYLNLTRADNSSLSYIRFRTGAINNWQIGTPIGGTYLWFLEGGVERVRIDNGGAVTFSSRISAVSNFSTYVGDGVFGATATPSVINLPNSNNRIIFGYYTTGDGIYHGRIGIRDTSDNRVSFGAIGPNTFTINTGTTDSERLRIDSNGNLGLGVTPSLWGILRGLQVGLTASVAGYISSTEGAFFSSNSFYNGGAFVYQVTGSATQYLQINGQHRWSTAASGTAGANITFTQAMTLFATGNLAIGTTTDAGYSLDVAGQVRFRTGTTALTASTGLHYIGHNQNTQFIGFNFQGVAATDMFFGRGPSFDDLIISTSNTGSPAERVRFKQNGNVLIGTSTDAGFRLDVNGTMRVSGASTFSSSVSISGLTYIDGAATALRTNNTVSYTTLESRLSGTRSWQIDNVSNAFQLYMQGASAYVFNIATTGAATFSADATINGVRVGKGPNSLSGNTVLGATPLNGVTTGTNNVAIGTNALRGTTTGSYNIAIGTSAGGIGAAENTTGSLNIFIGAECQGESATDSNRTWIGGPTTTSTWLAGNLLLGTKTNSTYRLDVVGTGRITNGLYVSGGIVAIQTLASGGTTIVVADSAGNLSTQPTSTYLSSLSGEATNSGSVVTLTNSAVIGKVLTGLNITSAAITASDSILSAFGKIQGQIDGLQGGTIYKGSWNASTNTPTITSSTGTQGHYYVVTTAGTTNINGVSSWAVGDWIIFNGTIWEKIPNVDAITSVNGQTGVVSLTTSNISEGTNLYYTDARARAAISLTTSGSSGASTYSSGVLNIPTYTLVGLGGVSTGTTITINGVSQDLSTNRTYNVGTVTSIGLAVPTGFTASSAITSSGSITLGFATGYALPTTASQANWDAAYNDRIVSAAVSGTTTKTLTLTQQDSGTITASWTDINTDAVTSVFGRTGAVVAVSGDYTTAQVTESGNLYYTDARARAAISLTTTGTSGAATYSGGVLNIPNYSLNITYNNNSDASYQMLWGSGNAIYGTSGILCNPFTDSINLSGTLFAGGITVTGFGRMYGGDFWHSGTANNGTRTETFKLGRFSDSETPAYVIYTDDTNGDILEFYSNRYTGDFRLTRNSETGLRNTMRVNSDNGGSVIDLYTGDGTTLGAKIQSTGDARFAYDVVAYYSFSDARLKTNVLTIENPLQKVMAMRGVTYEWKEGYKAGKKEIGLIAQEVMDIIPEVVSEKERVDGRKFLSVDYEHLTGLLIEAVKELKKEVDELKSK